MKYPYIQNKQKVNNLPCEKCKKVKEELFRLEWRVDIFQGNCEFEDICQSCFDKRVASENKKQKEYEIKMLPIWEKQRIESENREKFLEEEVKKLNIEIKKYNNGQWSFGDLIDWWTTTGTAINRKTKERYNFSFRDPQKIIKVIQNG